MPPRHVIELDHPVGDQEGVMIGQRNHTGAEPDMAGPLGRGGDKDFRRADDLEAAGMVLADPGFMVVQPIEQLHQVHVALQRERWVFGQIVERRQEDAAAQISFGHARWSPGAGSDSRLCLSLHQADVMGEPQRPGLCTTCSTHGVIIVDLVRRSVDHRTDHEIGMLITGLANRPTHR